MPAITNFLVNFNRYVVDVMNMLQGVYVLIIFVLKRNVFYTVTNRKAGGRRLDSQRGRSGSSRNEFSSAKRNMDRHEAESMVSSANVTQNSEF